MHPVRFARLRIEAVDKSRKITHKQQTGIRIDRDGRDASVKLVVAPGLAGLRDVSGFRGIDAGQNADPFSVFRVLPGGDINAVFIKDRSGVYFTRAFRRGILDWLAFLHFVIGWIAVELPN